MSETTELQTPMEVTVLHELEAQPRGGALATAVANGASRRRPWSRGTPVAASHEGGEPRGRR
jgi:hypothetical protein